MIKLYQFPAAWGLPNPSPFCMKLEVYMRLAEVPYEIVTMADPRKAPKGKLPMIEHNGHRIADSEFCLYFLAEQAAVDLDGHLSPAERAAGYGFQKMLDETFYWAMVYSRWIDPRVWPALKQKFFGNFPPVVRDILPAMIRRTVKRALHAQGTGRHSAKEIYFLADKCLQALSDFLGEKPYLLGEQLRRQRRLRALRNGAAAQRALLREPHGLLHAHEGRRIPRLERQPIAGPDRCLKFHGYR
jgi:glutathione S-transferase